MSAQRPTDGEALLEHALWVRALAHGLVADHALAEDLAQDTCIAALEHPPATPGHARSWLRAVLVNFARQAGRAAGRRVARETRAARPESQPGALDVLVRAALHRELVEAVMALGEPFRTAILLRFFDGLPPRTIAQRLGVPLATVHSRLQRGLAQLRHRLDEKNGGERGAWVSALLPITSAPRPPLSSSLGREIGALTMSAKWKLATVIALVLCGGWGVWSTLQSDPTSTPRAGNALAREPEPLPESAGLAAVQDPPPDESAQRVAVGSAAVAPAAEQQPTSLVLLHGRVLDAEARPLRGIEVELRPVGARAQHGVPQQLRAESGADGRFEMPAPAHEGAIFARDEGLATVMTGSFKPGSSLEAVVVVAPARLLAGRVLDEDGGGLAAARLGLELPADFGARFPEVLDASQVVHTWTESSASGEFELARAPLVAGSRLVTSLAGYRSDVRPAPDYAERALEIVLSRARVEERALRGIVLAPDGSAVAGAHVALGSAHVLSDVSGAFAFDLSHDDEHALKLTALRRGFLPAEAQALADGPDGAPRWPDYVRLRLGGAPSRLAGRVVDEKGEPVARARVWLADATYFGLVEDSPAQVEPLLAGAASPAEIERRLAAAPAGTDLAKEMLSTPNLLWNWSETNAHGEFELGGLLQRSYGLRVMQPASLVHAAFGPFEAGSTGLTLVLKTEDVLPKVAGHVRSRSGEPIAGVRVGVERTVARVTAKLAHGESTTSIGWPGATTLTDAEGSFELLRVPAEGVSLTFNGDVIMSTYHELERKDDVEHLSIPATIRCHVQLELGERPERCDSFRVLDENGGEVSIFKFRGGEEYSSSSFPLSAGHSEVFALAEGVRTFVLCLHGKEVERHDVALRTSELNWIRF